MDIPIVLLGTPAINTTAAKTWFVVCAFILSFLLILFIHCVVCVQDSAVLSTHTAKRQQRHAERRNTMQSSADTGLSVSFSALSDLGLRSLFFSSVIRCVLFVCVYVFAVFLLSQFAYA